jgi:hypothetical protein
VYFRQEEKRGDRKKTELLEDPIMIICRWTTVEKRVRETIG